ncbi:hypothetical protein NDU88_001588 [Pleurodeles waltl]|uniref:Uncharacterized protein n=1 Tax=Pleurodeles waltl TaxID=8319 RepID=A0AAV7VWX6_PLEWA|nr:hypothetical protein NDU88_001588 [Pleurodeles waltl]
MGLFTPTHTFPRLREKTPRQPKKTLPRGGTKLCRDRDRQKPWKTTADPGKPNGKAATLQEKRGLSRYGVRDKGNRAGGRRCGKEGGKGSQKGTTRGTRGRKGWARNGHTEKKGRQTGERGREKTARRDILIYVKAENRENKKTIERRQTGEQGREKKARRDILSYMKTENREREKEENNKKGRQDNKDRNRTR